MGKGRRAKPKEEPASGGRAALAEDLPRVTVAMRLKAEVRSVRGPRATETGAFSVSEVERRILRAMQTLRAMPDRERKFFVVKSGYPDHVRDHIDAYAAVEARVPRFKPTPTDVSEYLTSLSWVRHLLREKWQLVWWRSFGFSFGLMAKYRGQSDETMRRQYREALTDAWIAANGMEVAA